jgi:hypothetical protein
MGFANVAQGNGKAKRGFFDGIHRLPDTEHNCMASSPSLAEYHSYASRMSDSAAGIMIARLKA